MTERDIQRDSVKALRKLGYWVWVTSTNRPSRCTTGTPDVIVALGRRGLCVALEFKSKDGDLTGEQKLQVKNGAIVIVRSFEDCINAIATAIMDTPDAKLPRKV